MPSYRYTHAVGLGETSAVGNVYFARYFEWQGRCREAFLAEHCPGVVDLLLRQEVAFLTSDARCTYCGDFGFRGFSAAWIDMSLLRFRGGRMTLGFEYRDASRPEVLVATGEQQLCCKERRGADWVARPFPAELARALLRFADEDELRRALESAIEFQPARGRPALECDACELGEAAQVLTPRPL